MKSKEEIKNAVGAAEELEENARNKGWYYTANFYKHQQEAWEWVLEDE